MILFRLLYLWVLFPVFLFALLIGSLFNKKIAAGLKARIYKKKTSPPPKGAMWIHASSGEFEYAKPVITQLKARHPEIPVLVTYFSPTYAKNIENFKGVDFSAPLPLDLPGPLSQFIRTHQPRALLIARTDLWPELLYQCQRAKVPAYLFSATINENSSFITKWWRAFLLRQLNGIFLVADKDLKALPEDLQKKSSVLGDTRFDQVFARLEKPKPLPPYFQKPIADRVMVCGSTWPEDEEVLIEVMKRSADMSLRWIIAPHEPTDSHLDSLEKKLRAKGLSSQRLSQADEQTKIVLVDRVGILAELYTQADLAFVGGSFRKKVHSVMEPLAAGCLTFVGPYHENNGEALLFKGQFVKAVSNADEFAQELQKGSVPKSEIKNTVAAYKGATDRLLDQLF